ncbi:MAG: hypothetical protein QOD92_1645 [Acidimicrobiaceae bacterium]|jgi:hypothetical protein
MSRLGHAEVELVRVNRARRLLVCVVVAILFPAAQPAVGASFTRTANTSAGRALYEIGDVTITNGSEAWVLAGKDVLPFNYEQGVSSTDTGQLVFNSRGQLFRTTLGCPAPDDDAVPCYDALAENQLPISGAEGQAGFNHIGDTSIGRAGPAEGFLLTPLEKSPGNGIDKIFKVFDVATLQTAGRLEVPGPFSHHSWVMVDPTGNFMVNADATIRHLDVYRIIKNPAPANDEERIQLVRATELDITLDEGIPEDVGPTGCSFHDDLTVYCVDWIKNDLKHDIRTDVYRFRFAAPVGATDNTGAATLAFSYTIAHTIPSITYGLEGEGVTFYRREPGGPLEFHEVVRGERLDSVNLLHFVLASEAGTVGEAGNNGSTNTRVLAETT